MAAKVVTVPEVALITMSTALTAPADTVLKAAIMDRITALAQVQGITHPLTETLTEAATETAITAAA